MFDILRFCRNIVDLHFGDSITPFRAANQVATTSNQYLKRLEISSQFSVTAYIEYIRIIQPLDRLRLNVGEEMGYNIFRMLEPFAEKYQNFKTFTVALGRDYYPMIGFEDKDMIYDFLCKIKGDSDVLYDFVFDNTGHCFFVKVLSIRKNSLKFTWIPKSPWGEQFKVEHQIIDRSGIAKSLTCKRECPESFVLILKYAKSFPRVKTLNIEVYGGNHFKAAKTEIITNHIIPSKTVFDQLYHRIPK